MSDSVLSLWTDANEALKVIDDKDYCLSDDNRMVLMQLRCFLKQFQWAHSACQFWGARAGTNTADTVRSQGHHSTCCWGLWCCEELQQCNCVESNVWMLFTSLRWLTPPWSLLFWRHQNWEEVKNMLCTFRIQDFDRNCSAMVQPLGNAVDVHLLLSTSSYVTASSSKKQKLMEKFKHAVVTNSPPSADLDLCTENEIQNYLHAATENDGSTLQFWKKTLMFIQTWAFWWGITFRSYRLVYWLKQHVGCYWMLKGWSWLHTEWMLWPWFTTTMPNFSQ